SLQELSDVPIRLSSLISQSQMQISAGPGLSITWTSIENEVPQPVLDYSTIVGDHITLNAIWEENLNITWSSISFEKGILYSNTQSLVIPDAGYNPDLGPIDDTQFSWMIVDVEEEATLKVSVNFSNSDCDIYAWSYAGHYDYMETAWNFLGDQTSTNSSPEVGEFEFLYFGDPVAFGCFNRDRQPGQWTLRIEPVSIIEAGPRYNNSIEFDIVDFLPDDTYHIRVTGESVDMNYIEWIRDVTFVSNLEPMIDLLSPCGGEVWKGSNEITWNASDPNIDDVLSYEVFVSNDAGETFMLLSTSDEMSYIWDTDDWTAWSSYTIMVIATDGRNRINCTSLPFTAGNHTQDEDDDPPSIWCTLELEPTPGGPIWHANWRMIDRNPDAYHLQIDGIEVSSGIWENGDLTFAYTEYREGGHYMIMTATDEYGNSNSLTRWIHFEDDPPALVGLEDVNLTINQDSVSLIWNAFSFKPNRCILFEEDVVVANWNWSGSDIQIRFDGIQIGEHEYTLLVVDTDGQSSSDTIIISRNAPITHTVTTDTITTTSTITTTPTTSIPAQDIPVWIILSLIVTIASMGIIIVLGPSTIIEIFKRRYNSK
ncbi:MAG: hypothetical protein RTU30_16390, partial [Candidatus Thorarchaeota archaeon]